MLPCYQTSLTLDFANFFVLADRGMLSFAGSGPNSRTTQVRGMLHPLDLAERLD